MATVKWDTFRRLLSSTVFVLTLSNEGIAAQADPAGNPHPIIKTLIKTTQSWDGAAYSAYPSGQPELTVLEITIPANASLNWHQHPMPNVAYVVSGELTIEKAQNHQKIHIRAGQVLPELVNQLHRGVTGPTPVVLIVFYAGTPGMPLSQAGSPPPP